MLRTRSLPLLLIGLVLGAALAGLAPGPGLAGAEADAPETGHRYVLLLGGFNSSSASREGSEVTADFAQIERAIRGDGGAASVKGLRSVVYFSYGAAAMLQDAIAGGAAPASVDNVYCAGWENACPALAADQSAWLSAHPVYRRGDTRLPVDLQADALNWLLGQILRQDGQAQVDLVGFSLGGVVATRWGARYGGGSGPPERVRSIVLLDSPVGGILGATPEELVQKLLADFTFGKTVTDELRPTPAGTPDQGSIVDSLKGSLAWYNVASIEATSDYLVNEQPVILVQFGPTVIGRGAAGWPPDRLIRWVDDFGGSLIQNEVDVTNPAQLFVFAQRLIANHGTVLTADKSLSMLLDGLSFLKPTGPLADGDFVKGSGDAVYRLEAGHKRAIKDWATYLQLGGSPRLTNVRQLTNDALAAIPD